MWLKKLYDQLLYQTHISMITERKDFMYLPELYFCQDL